MMMMVKERTEGTWVRYRFDRYVLCFALYSVRSHLCLSHSYATREGAILNDDRMSPPPNLLAQTALHSHTKVWVCAV